MDQSVYLQRLRLDGISQVSIHRPHYLTLQWSLKSIENRKNNEYGEGEISEEEETDVSREKSERWWGDEGREENESGTDLRVEINNNNVIIWSKK